MVQFIIFNSIMIFFKKGLGIKNKIFAYLNRVNVVVVSPAWWLQINNTVIFFLSVVLATFIPDELRFFHVVHSLLYSRVVVIEFWHGTVT